jgi:hypothetical protein
MVHFRLGVFNNTAKFWLVDVVFFTNFDSPLSTTLLSYDSVVSMIPPEFLLPVGIAPTSIPPSPLYLSLHLSLNPVIVNYSQKSTLNILSS